MRKQHTAHFNTLAHAPCLPASLAMASSILLNCCAAAAQVFEIPFNSMNKWSLAVTSCPGDASQQIVMMKGAPEIVLTKCSHHLHNREEKVIDEVWHGFFLCLM